ncbi:hypothetical protein [Glycomyces buryatensis]|uniref:Uncharacterized protein n=1 Tax=Glycomyces buryatensis TaxID=2570927 RepID=A0A4S8QJM5_9ACTN|nr:hypothetical protein [Glycomyces buryatensis]THV43205.1 hypothetical protein FAB82_02965 [Glycomyces buryatensis]
MNTILDLPIHPLAIHAPVILVPLLVLFGMLYLFVPPIRRAIGWVVAALTLIAPATAYGAVWSGEQLADFLYPNGWPEAVTEHYDYGIRLLWILLGLIPVWWLFAALDRGRRASALRDADSTPTVVEGEDGESVSSGASDPAATGRRLFMIILGVIAFALLALAAWMVFNSGDTGASMHWEGWQNRGGQ